MQYQELAAFSEAVEYIYWAAIEPAMWPMAVGRITSLFNSCKGLLFTPTLSPMDGGFAFPHGIDEASMNVWGSRYVEHDLWAARGVGLGLTYSGNVLLDTDVATDAEFESSIFYREFLSTLDIGRLCCGIVSEGATAEMPLITCSIFRSRSAALFSEYERGLARLLTNHLSRALQTTLRLRQDQLRVAASLAAMDRLVCGVALIGHQGNVLFVNRPAQDILARRDGLSMRAGHPLKDGLGWLSVAGRPGEALEADIRRAISNDPQNVTHAGAGLRVPRISGGAAYYVVQVAPLSSHSMLKPGNQSPGAIVFISDPSAPAQVDPGLLRSVYRLTPAEASVARELLAGHTPATIAAALQSSENTVKKHLQSIFDKTGTSRQAELMKLLMGLASGAGSQRTESPTL